MEIIEVLGTVGGVLRVERVCGELQLGEGVREDVPRELLFVSSWLLSVRRPTRAFLLQDVAERDRYEHRDRDRHAYADPDYLLVNATSRFPCLQINKCCYVNTQVERYKIPS